MVWVVLPHELRRALEEGFRAKKFFGEGADAHLSR